MRSNIYNRGENILLKGDSIESLIMFYSGFANLVGYFDWKDETLQLEAVKLKEGSWYGDYQIMLYGQSEFDLVAGGHQEGKERTRARGIPSNLFTLTYQIDAEVLIKILNSYPTFRSFFVARSLVRNSYF